MGEYTRYIINMHDYMYMYVCVCVCVCVCVFENVPGRVTGNLFCYSLSKRQWRS